MKYASIFLLIMLPLMPASASNDDSSSRAIVSWAPQGIDSVFVDTDGKTITYSITTVESMTMNSLTLDGASVSGIVNENTFSYTRTWDNRSIGFHTLIYNGSNNHSQTAFRWYVSVYDQYGGGNLFEVINDVLDDHAVDVKVRMLEYTIEKHGSKSSFTAKSVNRIHNEMAGQQNSSETLGMEFRKGDITLQQYISSLEQIRKSTRNNIKLAKKMEKIAGELLKDEKLVQDFTKISEKDDSRGEEHAKARGNDKEKGATEGSDNNRVESNIGDHQGNSGNSGGSSGNSGSANSGNSGGNSGNSGGGNSGNSGGNSGNSGGGNSGNSGGNSGNSGGGNAGNSGNSGNSGGGNSGNGGDGSG